MVVLSDKYKRNNTFEAVVSSLNEALYLKKFETFPTITKPQTTIHVIGAPRSGTTLLSQMIFSFLDVGYVNHLIASFWQAPVYGIHLSKQLLDSGYLSNFDSDFGSTNNILEPHEFSYFWKKHLNYDDFMQRTYDENHSINWEEFRNELYQMVDAYEKPMVLKSFLLGFHAKEAVKHIPQTIFIFIQRNVYQNAYSIFKLREKRFRDISFWASTRPHQYSELKNETIFRQIIGQVYLLNYEYSMQLNDISIKNKLFLSYNNLCESPQEILKQVHSKINNFSEVNFTQKDPSTFIPNKANIPNDILVEFEKAEAWLFKTYPELEELRC